MPAIADVSVALKHVINLWNVVSPFLHYSMEPRQHKQRLRSDG